MANSLNDTIGPVVSHSFKDELRLETFDLFISFLFIFIDGCFHVLYRQDACMVRNVFRFMRSRRSSRSLDKLMMLSG